MDHETYSYILAFRLTKAVPKFAHLSSSRERSNARTNFVRKARMFVARRDDKTSHEMTLYRDYKDGDERRVVRRGEEAGILRQLHEGDDPTAARHRGQITMRTNVRFAHYLSSTHAKL